MFKNTIYFTMWKRTKNDRSYGLLRKRKLTNGTAARTHARMSAGSAALINKRMERVFINKSKKNKEKIVGDCQPGALTNEARPGSLHYLKSGFLWRRSFTRRSDFATFLFCRNRIQSKMRCKSFRISPWYHFPEGYLGTKTTTLALPL